jgi:hypothetical protein
MLNLFSKTTSWMVASLLATTVAIAAQDNNNTKGRPQKSYEQGHEVQKNQLMPAYNAPANIEVRGSWDVYATGSFLYWQAREDNLELGIATNGDPSLTGGPFIAINPTLAPTNFDTSGEVANSDFSWGPGFKFGLGMNLDYDNWDAYAEYTWFHKTSNTSFPSTNDDECECECEPFTDYIFPTRFIPVSMTADCGCSDSVKGYKFASETWNVKLDFLDVSLARSYYLGTKLSVRPFFGARGAWIRQTLTTNFNEQGVNNGTAIVSVPELYAIHSAKTRSWGVGPRAGFDSNWMLGYGFRLIGDVSADVLYTRYHINNKSVLHTSYITVNPVSTIGTATGRVSQEHIDMLRPHTDFEMGFGWGSYFDNSNWHVDLLATYGYQVFWDQNMFRMFTDTVSAHSFLPNGNLYVHGLTFTARVDF